MVYRDITFDKDNIAKPMATIPGMFRNTITLFGLSKSYGLASLRAGFLIADEIIIREVVNRVFQEMDSSPDIVGKALMGAFNATEERNRIYEEYFTEIRSKYVYRYNLLKALVEGIDSIKDKTLKVKIEKEVEKNILDEKTRIRLLQGLPYVKFPENLEPEAGFFAILDFTELKGKTYNGKAIHTERDLLEFFYYTNRLRFLIGQSISWPYHDELIGRVTFAFEEDKLINCMLLMNNSIQKLITKNSYYVRFNELNDQEQMAHIKVDGWRNAYKNIIDEKYLNQLNYEEQTKKYIESFDDYKNAVIVAVNKESEEVVGYSCFDEFASSDEYDCELTSLYIDPRHLREGIGSLLLKETINYLKTKKKEKMILWCLEDNDKALEFYKKTGGKIQKEKLAKIGDKIYKEYGIIYEIKDEE